MPASGAGQDGVDHAAPSPWHVEPTDPIDQLETTPPLNGRQAQALKARSAFQSIPVNLVPCSYCAHGEMVGLPDNFTFVKRNFHLSVALDLARDATQATTYAMYLQHFQWLRMMRYLAVES
jgi:hypothetical protein